jgi:protein tyrosine/serine phosphatase
MRAPIGLLLVVVLLLLSSAAQARSRGLPLPNFHRVTSGIYRSGRPTEEGLRRLAKQDGKRGAIKAIINLEDHPRAVRREIAMAARLGIRVIWKPVRHRAVQNERYTQEIQEAMSDPANQPCLVHCWAGNDRTGMEIAIHRVTRQGWSAKRARAEMMRLGFHREYDQLQGHFERLAREHRQKRR